MEDQVIKQRLNALPVPTWNRLGVNEAGAEFSLPDAAGGEAEENRTEEHRTESGLGAYFDAYVREHAEKQEIRPSQKPEKERHFVTVSCGQNGRGTHLPASSYFFLNAAAGETLSVLQWIDGEIGDLSVLTEICAGEGARVKLIQVQTASKKSKVRLGVSAREEKNASVEVIRAVFGGRAAACGARAYLDGDDSRFLLQTAYFAEGAQSFDLNDIALHTGLRTRSDLHTSGVLAGESKKTMRGTIDFRKGASYAIGHESEEVLLLSDQVRNKIVPLILCAEENVEGQHAASSGKPDEKMLYYLMTRGLSRGEATAALIHGRFAPVIDRIPEADIRAALTAETERRLENDGKQGQ